jgi:cytochrome P450
MLTINRFGQSSNTLTKPTPEAEEFVEAFEYSLVGATNKARIGWVGKLVPDRKLDWANRTTRTFVERYVSEVLQTNKVAERKYVFLNAIVDSGAPPEKLTASLLSIILGGRDTTAAVLSCLFWMLARHPEVTAKLKREIDELGGQKPDWEQMKNMRYLNWTIKEGGFHRVLSRTRRT